MTKQKLLGKNSRIKGIVNVILKVLLTLMFSLSILGATGMFPEPTREYYNSDQAFTFIQILMNDASYIQYIMTFIFVVSIVLIWTGREALFALLISPITVNVVGFHLFLDGGLLTGGAVMGNILLLINMYFLWDSKEEYMNLFKKKSK